ncbi:MAG: HNH endonuclease [Clostridia bacterium]|nr:HNH endonuclease [Clostridia bacterium]
MKRLTVSELLAKKEIKPFLYGAFLNRIMTATILGQPCFYAYTSFRISKAVYQDDFPFYAYADELIASLNHFSGFYNWEKYNVKESHMELRFYLVNDLQITSTQFYALLYKKMLTCDWLTGEEFNDDKKSFIRGFMELRGSVDTTAKLIAQDYFYNNNVELKKAQILTNMMDLPIAYANFNARNLQPQYVNGKNQRNAQFRINLMFYANQIGFINKYKATVFDHSYRNHGKTELDGITFFALDLPKRTDYDVTFIKYLNFFTNFIYEKRLTPVAVAELRKKLGFTDNSLSEKTNRNRTIIELFNEIAEDKCAICGATETFVNKRTGKQHFEVHHVISYKNGVELDNIANLVKLCPICHDMLKKNATAKEKQIKAILKILSEHNEILEFAKSYLQIDDINEIAEEIWIRLG